MIFKILYVVCIVAPSIRFIKIYIFDKGSDTYDFWFLRRKIHNGAKFHSNCSSGSDWKIDSKTKLQAKLNKNF